MQLMEIEGIDRGDGAAEDVDFGVVQSARRVSESIRVIRESQRRMGTLFGEAKCTIGRIISIESSENEIKIERLGKRK